MADDRQAFEGIKAAAILQPGDCVLVTLTGRPSRADIAHYSHLLAARFPDVEITVASGIESVTIQPASGGVVEQGGPLTAEEATADYVALPSLGRVVGTAQIIRTGYLCVTGGDTCPGHRSKWELCGMAPEPVVPLLHTHEAGGPYRDCPECIAKAGHIRTSEGHDRG